MAAESQIPIASPNQVRRFARWLSLFYGTTFGLGGTYLPFFPVWLKAIGIDPSWIGMIAAAPAVTRFTVLPLITGTAERHRKLRGAIMLTGFATALNQCNHGDFLRATTFLRFRLAMPLARLAADVGFIRLDIAA